MNRSVWISAASILALMLVPIRAQYTINTTTLNSYNGVHPRLFMDANTVNTLKSNITTWQTGVPRWGEMWLSSKLSADAESLKPPIAYITPGANDEQSWQREVGDNVANLAMAGLLTKVTVPNTDSFWLEAEDAPLTAPMIFTADATASGLAGISTPTGGAVNSPNTQPPSATYNISTLVPSYYHIWARVYAPNSSSNTFWLDVDGAPFSLTTNTFGAWSWVNCGHWHLTPGTHQMHLTYQKPGMRFDKFLVTNNGAYIPTGLDVEQHWVEAEHFTLNANGDATHPNNLLVTTRNALAPLGDAVATGAAWLETWAGNTGNGTLPAATATPDAQRTIGVNGGTYDVWARFKAPYNGHDSIYFEIDTAGFSAPGLDATIAFPYNTLISPALLPYNKTLPAALKNLPYREWVWKKVAGSVSLTAGNHVLKFTNRNTNGGTGFALDRLAVLPAGTAAPVDPNKYLAAARNWAIASCNYPLWGSGSYANGELGAGHQLLGLGLFYDWCYANIGLLDRQIITNTLSTRGAGMNSATATEWWKNSFLQNHLTVCETGLTAAALALHGDAGMPDTLPWLQTALGKLNNTVADLGSDGADQEGIGYWSYEAEFLLKYMDMAKKLMGADMFATPWVQQTANYRLFFDLPANSQSLFMTHINISDDPGYEWYGPDHILRKLASQSNNPSAQWLAEQYDAKGFNSTNVSAYGGAPWLNLLWYNPSIAETSPVAAGADHLAFFTDLDFVVARTGWDGNESVLTFQCGPMMGHGVQAKDAPTWIDWGSNHNHPDVNHFSLFGAGDWLIENEGYTYKFTAYCNSLLINGAGQLGEGAFTFNGTAAKLEDSGGVLDPAIDDALTVTTPALDYLVGNTTKAYASTTGLTKFRRHLLFLKPDVLVVVDDVALSAAKPLELHFFPNHTATFSQVGSTYTTTNAHSKLNFNVLSAPAQVALTNKVVSTIQEDGSPRNRTAYSLATTSNLASMSTAVGFAWSPLAGAPKTVTYFADPDGTAWKFKAGAQTIVLDRNATANAPDEKARAVTTLEAESVAPASPMSVFTDATASGGRYISTVAGTASNIPDALPSPSVQYTFSAPDAGAYSVWARVQAANAASNSFYFAVNPTGSTVYTQKAATTYGSWVWVKLAQVSLTQGNNVLALKYGAANCKIDEVIVTDDASYTPYGIY